MKLEILQQFIFRYITILTMRFLTFKKELIILTKELMQA